MFTGDINIELTGLAHSVSSAPGMKLAGKPVTSHLVIRKSKGTFCDLSPHQTIVHLRAQGG